MREATATARAISACRLRVEHTESKIRKGERVKGHTGRLCAVELTTTGIGIDAETSATEGAGAPVLAFFLRLRTHWAAEICDANARSRAEVCVVHGRRAMPVLLAPLTRIFQRRHRRRNLFRKT